MLLVTRFLPSATSKLTCDERPLGLNRLTLFLNHASVCARVSRASSRRSCARTAYGCSSASALAEGERRMRSSKDQSGLGEGAPPDMVLASPPPTTAAEEQPTKLEGGGPAPVAGGRGPGRPRRAGVAKSSREGGGGRECKGTQHHHATQRTFFSISHRRPPSPRSGTHPAARTADRLQATTLRLSCAASRHGRLTLRSLPPAGLAASPKLDGAAPDRSSAGATARVRDSAPFPPPATNHHSCMARVSIAPPPPPVSPPRSRIHRNKSQRIAASRDDRWTPRKLRRPSGRLQGRMRCRPLT